MTREEFGADSRATVHHDLSSDALGALARAGSVWWMVDAGSQRVTLASSAWRLRFEQHPASGPLAERPLLASIEEEVLPADLDKVIRLWRGGTGDGREVTYRLAEPRGRPRTWTEQVFEVRGARPARLHVARPQTAVQDRSPELTPWQARQLILSTPDGVAVLGPREELLFASEEVKKLSRGAPAASPTEPGAWLGRPHPDDYPAVSAAMRRCRDQLGAPQRITCRVEGAEGARQVAELSIAPARLGFPPGSVIVTVRDATRLTYTDPGTGLYNPVGFRQYLGTLTSSIPEAEAPRLTAVFAAGLENHASLVETHGQELADLVLARCAKRVQAQLSRFGQPASGLARLTEDTIGFILLRCTERRVAAQLVRAVLGALSSPVELAEGQVVARPVCGVRLIEGIGELEVATQQALQARRQAAEQGPRTWAYFDPERQARLQESLALEGALVGALEAGELRAWFQPIVNLGRRSIAGLEVLARWHHPKLGHVAPNLFIPAARRAGVLHRLDLFILLRALDQVAAWRKEGLWRDRSLWVNVSPQALAHPAFTDTVLRALEERDLPGSQLILEISETLAESDIPLVLGILEQLRSSGVRLALDDFGTGQSSLAMLGKVPFEIFKLDRSLVVAAGAGRPREARMVQAMGAVAESLGLTVVAEGIETEAEVRPMAEFGFELAQGYLFSHPLDAGDTAALLSRPHGAF